MSAVLSAEWLKLRSIRSTGIAVAAALAGILLGVVVAWSAVNVFDGASPERRATARIAEIELVTLLVPQLCMGVLGVLAITSEYVTGTIRLTFTAEPRRRRVLAAKAAIVGAVALAVGPVVVFATYFVSRAMIGDRFGGVYLAPFAEKAPMMLASGVSVMVFALAGLGFGAILRSSAGAIASIVVLVYLLPMIAGNLPEPWSERLGSVMLPALPGQITGADLTHSVYGALLPPPVAAALLAAYAVVPLVVAALLITRRDA
ncbi:ABC transporter permease [Sphaerisporangium sp. TRM90804]|uniref:ABC transporter permease n=1 Tax=Sphaerisporangium sp. TRM90804 TaxID=3031113 RepID=UPI00244D0BEE|nr:ABC transporter permease [Sphaerisporangium sp. TRM90804]MDH2427016.1 ABC transporter permease subunit [Sphaerisporangium sp. TRM90804]